MVALAIARHRARARLAVRLDLNETGAVKDGLEPALIDVVRHRRPLNGVAEQDAALIQFGRELFASHNVSEQTYATALKIFGERDLVDFVALMAQHSADAVMLAAFDQRLPAGQIALCCPPHEVRNEAIPCADWCDVRNRRRVAAARQWVSRRRALRLPGEIPISRASGPTPTIRRCNDPRDSRAESSSRKKRWPRWTRSGPRFFGVITVSRREASGMCPARTTRSSNQ